MKALRIFARVFIGAIFVMSGFVKGVDPVGTAIKFGEYFTDAFGVPQLDFISMPLAFIMNAAEFIIGAALLLGVRMRLTAITALCFMGFFLPLTFYIAVDNSVTDCGCFGDFVKLDNWQTFWKNVLFTPFVIFIFWQRKNYKPIASITKEWIIAGSIIVAFLSLELYCYRHLPIIDFRPYKIGNVLYDQTIIPEGMEPDKYGYIYHMTNTVSQETKEIDSETYISSNIWQDTTWQITNTEGPILLKKGYTPPIHDFSFENDNGYNITDSLLFGNNYYFLAISHKVEKGKIKNFKKLIPIAKKAKEKGWVFIMATSSTNDKVNYMLEETGYPFYMYNADNTMLKTIIRSNPGLVLLKDGKVINKWHFTDLPSSDELEKELSK